MSDLRRRRTKSEKKQEAPTLPETQNTELWAREGVWQTGIVVLLSARLIGALCMPIPDCDESFNYWEPLHYLIYGRGTRTWEYSPEFALRSYLYLGIHWCYATLFRLVGIEVWGGKIAIFYGLRVILAGLCGVAESRFCSAIKRKFGMETGIYCLIFLSFSTGMCHSAGSFLPQSFTMCTLTLCLTSWINSEYTFAVVWMGVSGLLGWPFVAVMALLLGLDVLYAVVAGTVSLPRIVVVALLTTAVVLVPAFAIDYYFYKQLVFAQLNIALYNGNPIDENGSSLYGTEPWYFYLINLALNFNVALPLALLAPFCAVSPILAGKSSPKYRLFLKVISPAFVWLFVMMSMPHKEERFLFVIYPSLALAAAFALQSFKSLVQFVSHTIARFLAIAALLSFVVLSLSRSSALVVNYGAPLKLYQSLSDIAPSTAYTTSPGIARVCVGKEWYRFPSHFFLPDGPVKFQLEFLKSDFSGQLPKQFHDDPTWVSPSDFNDKNKEEMSRYLVDPKNNCDFIVDFDLEQQNEPHFAEEWGDTFEVVSSHPFLDASNSPMLTRALWIPVISARRNHFRPYQLLKRRNPVVGSRGKH